MRFRTSKKTVVARVIGSVSRDKIVSFVRETVAHKVSVLATDQWKGYRALDSEYERVSVDHSCEYVVGAIHTCTIDGFWSLLKRGIVGSYHKVSRKYLPLYIAEFQFRYNNRMNEDIFGEAIRGMLTRRYIVGIGLLIAVPLLLFSFAPSCQINNRGVQNGAQNQKSEAAPNNCPPPNWCMVLRATFDFAYPAR